MFRRLSLGLTALLAAGSVAVAAPGTTPAAHADSAGGHLVFIRNGDVWVAKPDGTGQVRMTAGGGYSDPSMSDNGRIAAIRGRSLVVLRADGSLLNQFNLPGLFVEGSCSTVNETPPLEAVISPDGTKVAWSQLRTSDCGGKWVIDDLTAITDVTGPNLRGLVLGYDPDWVGNGKIVVDDNDAMTLVPVGHSEPKGYKWFDTWDLWETYSVDLNSIAVSRDGARVAYLVDRYSSGPELVIDHPTTGNPLTTNSPGVPSHPGECQAVSGLPRPDNGPVLDDLMFSPDGNGLVHVEGNDVWTITGLKTGGCEQRTFTKVLAGVTDVSWSGYTGTVTAPDKVAPTVSITGVKVSHAKRTASIAFKATDNVSPAAAIRFQCKLDGGAKGACTSPKTYQRLKPGKHVVKVWATDKAGNTRSTSKSFTVKR